jgi:hypothetical protein
MRILVVFALVLLGGCAAGPSLEELESRAMLTGNWAEVEKRERVLALRQAQRGPQCPVGYVSYCEERYGDRRCGCLQLEGARVVVLRR